MPEGMLHSIAIANAAQPCGGGIDDASRARLIASMPIDRAHAYVDSGAINAATTSRLPIASKLCNKYNATLSICQDVKYYNII